MWDDFELVPVLIAEDSEDDLLVLQDALRRVGIQNPQVVATTGSEVLAILARAASDETTQFPGVLFLDLLMPGNNGLEVLRWLRDHEHPPLTIVVHTGVEDEELLRRARDLGATLYLPKGVRPNAIREVFRRARADWERELVPG
jgi:CheY-like chemotaxis protein